MVGFTPRPPDPEETALCTGRMKSGWTPELGWTFLRSPVDFLGYRWRYHASRHVGPYVNGLCRDRLTICLVVRAAASGFGPRWKIFVRSTPARADRLKISTLNFIFCWPCISLQILGNNQLEALFHVFIYFMSLHVSRVTALIIRRSNCIKTSSGIINLMFLWPCIMNWPY